MPLQNPSFFTSDLRDNELLNVRDFGAAGDGTTDDAAAINRAVTMASGRGGIVWFPGGTYITSQTIDIPAGVSLGGVGSKSVTISYTGGGVAVEATLGGSYTGDQWISGVSVTGTSAGDVGIRVGDTWGFSIRDVSVRGFTTGIGIQLYNDAYWTEGTHIENCRLENNSVGIGFTRSAASGFDSFGYTRITSTGINVPDGGTGLRLGDSLIASAHSVYNCFFELNIWLDDNSFGIAFDGDTAGEGNWLLATMEKETGATGTSIWGDTQPLYWLYKGSVYSVDIDDVAQGGSQKVGQNHFKPTATDEPGLQIQALGSQSAELIRLMDSSENKNIRLYGNGDVVGGRYYIGTNAGVFWDSGAGTPEGAVTAPVGSLFTRTDGGATTTLYVKTSGTGNTGWTAK